MNTPDKYDITPEQQEEIYRAMLRKKHTAWRRSNPDKMAVYNERTKARRAATRQANRSNQSA